MSYIGSVPTTAAFPFDQFSGTGAATSFTLTYAPASATSILVAISGVMQNPNLYSVIGTTLTFSPAPPTGTNNISVLYLGLPVIGSSSPGNTAFLSSTDLTATAGQTVFASAGSYTPGFVQVYRNGARLGNADFTATNGTTITLAVGATAGDLVTIEYYTLTSLVNALPLTGGTVTGSTTFNSTVTINGAAVSGFTGMKNRIINGNMAIDQRNAGATGTGNGLYVIDRWNFGSGVAGKMTYGQNRGSLTPPAGFTNYFGFITTTAYTVGASEFFLFTQEIEGYNVADLNFGKASAQTITVSFWVNSTLTGTFGGVLSNSAQNRSFPFTYTINAASTWEQKTVTVVGDTTGTWLTTNGKGLSLHFGLGVGSTFNGTATGAWQAATYLGATGATSVVGTLNATWNITGVQLECGSNATSFDYRPFGTELGLCQRYYQKWDGAPSRKWVMTGMTLANAVSYGAYPLRVTMRAEPTLGTSGTASDYCLYSGNTLYVLTSVPGINTSSVDTPNIGWNVAGVGDGRASQMGSNTNNGFLAFNAEL